MFIIEDELKKLPTKPGVYLMHDEKDNIIYVGKAINLKNRVRQYFQSSRNKGAKIEQMVTHIRRFEYIVTDSELEALVLECNLIKEHRPKYNTMLMDDKGYPFIKVTVNEAYPRIMLARTMQKDKAKYFGPYTSATAVKDTIATFSHVANSGYILHLGIDDFKAGILAAGAIMSYLYETQKNSLSHITKKSPWFYFF